MTDNFLNLELEFFKFYPSSSLTICNTYSSNYSKLSRHLVGSNYIRMIRAVRGPALTELKTVRESYMIEYWR